MALLIAVPVLAPALAAPAGAADRLPIVASHGDAFIAHTSASETWTIGGPDLELVVGFDTSRTLTLERVFNPTTNRSWDINPAPDASLTINGKRLVLGSRDGVEFLGADADETANGVRLTFNFEERTDRIRVSRVYATYPGSPTIETWTRIDASASAEIVQLSDVVGWQLSMPAGTVHWVGGLRGDTSDNAGAGTFDLTTRDLDPGETVEIGATGRSTEQFLPLAVVDGPRDKFYGGMMWSGAWQIAFARAPGNDAQMTVTAAFPDLTLAVPHERPLELPHAFFGVTPQSVSESAALQQFIVNGIRRGRPFRPLVTYNTWFPYGTAGDEPTVMAEIDSAVQLGVELVVVDAGWYAGAGVEGMCDFESGLGSWTADPDRFPSGLYSLTEYAHEHGVSFGLWVEPERIALDLLDGPGQATEGWLATSDGQYGSSRVGQLCLAHPQAREWVLDRIVALIESVHPDYLKWDNNAWVNCNREGHGHGPSDGNFWHVQGLYEILEELRARYPELLIENVSGGGNRLDFGMLAYTNVGWMDDRTSPSTIVRHNLQGLSSVLPPAYLLSFVLDNEHDPMFGDDLRLLVRSRMPGVLGLAYPSHQLLGDLGAQLADEIGRYKWYRNTIAPSHAILLSSQAPVNQDGWEVMQELANDRGSAVIFAFKSDSSDGRVVVNPRGLLPDVTYEAWSIDTGLLGAATGEELMLDGIEINHAGAASRAHVIYLAVQ